MPHSPRRIIRYIVLFAAVFSLASGMFGCGGKVKISGKDITYVDADQLQKMVDNSKQTVVLIDVRAPDAFAGGHLPGAINIHLPQLRRRDIRLLDADVRVVYASGGINDPLSDVAAKKLMNLGYGTVYNFRGGIAAWQNAGLELAEGP